MKKIILVVLLVFVPVFAFADNSYHVEWDYTADTAGLESFRLYDESNNVVENFPADARVGDFVFPLNNCSGFYLTAYSPERESPISNVYTLCPAEVVRFEAVGSLRIIRSTDSTEK